MTRGERTRPRRTLWAWLAVWLVVAGTCVLAHVATFTKLSPIDEYQHVDYLDKTMSLEHVNGGEKVGELAMREQACRGVPDLQGYELPPCDAETLTPEQFPGGGFNHTYGDPPTYYAITGPLARGVQELTGLDSIVTAARSIGVLWLAAGLMATFLLSRRLGANDWSAAGATLLLASTPVVLGATTTVTTDAPQLLIGGLLTLLAVGVVAGRASAWWLVPAAAAATAFKTTSLTVVGMVGLFLLIAALSRRTVADADSEEAGPVEQPSGRRPGLLAVALLLGAAVVPLVTWMLVTKATVLASVDEIQVTQMFEVDSIGWHELSTSFTYLLTPVFGAYMAPFLRTDTVGLGVVVLQVLLVLGPAGLAWYGRAREASTWLGTSVLASMVLGGPALVLLLFVTDHVTYGIPGRYGISLLPAAAACLAVAASRRRSGGPALVVLGVLGMAALLAACA